MSESLRKIVARNIRTLRKRKGISQLEFARRCGLAARYASRIENDPQNLGLDTMGKIAEVLEVPISALYGLPTTAEPLPKDAADAFSKVIELLELYRDIFTPK